MDNMFWGYINRGFSPAVGLTAHYLSLRWPSTSQPSPLSRTGEWVATREYTWTGFSHADANSLPVMGGHCTTSALLSMSMATALSECCQTVYEVASTWISFHLAMLCIDLCECSVTHQRHGHSTQQVFRVKNSLRCDEVMNGSSRTYGISDATKALTW